MLSHLLHRLGTSLVVLFGLSLLAFFVVRLVPGDTVTAMLGLNYDPARAAALREEYGLDKAVVAQYGIWLANLARGDFGTTSNGRPVTSALGEALPVTLELATLALCFAVVVGVPLGLLAAVRHNRPTDYGVAVVSLLGLSVPGFWLGTLLILFVSLKLGWLPSGRFVSLTDDPIRNLRSMALPAVALGAAVMAVLTRMTRSSVLEVADADHVRTARAKGLPRPKVLLKHVLRNGLAPVLTIAGIQLGYLLGGSVVIEEVFSLNGLGRLILGAVRGRDYALVQASILLIGVAFLLINLAVDLLYVVIDPRLRTGGTGAT